MHIDHLTKSQVILLALLVSFVSSIATGIVTVSLVDQAPPAVTETINRVVERTAQTIAPAVSQTAAAAAPTQPQTIVVAQDDAIANAVAKASPAVVRIENADGAMVAVGVAVSPSLLLSDGTALIVGSSYAAITADGTDIPLTYAGQIAGSIAAFRVATSSGSALAPIALPKKPLALGETAVALTGLSVPKIAKGIITALGGPDTASATLETDIPLDSLAAGSVLIDDSGDLLGMYLIGSDHVAPIAASAVSALLAGQSDD